MTAPHTPAPLARTLTAVAAEVADLAALSDQLQSLVSGALVADTATHADHLREFQAIDLLVQRLQGVSVFMAGLARAAPDDWRLDAASAAAEVALTDLARRLTGEDHADTAPAGDFELFG